MTTKINVENCNFDKHVGAYSMYEEEFNTPFYEMLTMRIHKLNFYQSSKEQMDDQIE